MRQASTYNGQRKAALCTTVKRRNKGGKLIVVEILQFIDEDNDCCIRLSSGKPNLFKKYGQIDLEIAVVG